MSQSTLFDATARALFCHQYFTAVGAKCLVAKPMYREYELPIEIDKELTDRPYYWLWVERTGEPVKPTILRLSYTDESATEESARLKEEAMQGPEWAELNEVQKIFFRPPTAEYVAFGSFRLEKIFDSVKRRGMVACVEQMDATMPTSPWLVCHCLVSYRCDLTRQRLLSIAVNLCTRQVMTNVMPQLDAMRMRTIPMTVCVANAELGVDAGLNAVMDYVHNELAAESHDWALEAQQRLMSELDGINLYYDSILADIPDDERALVESERLRKRRENEERIEPRIDCEITQMALVRCHLPVPDRIK